MHAFIRRFTPRVLTYTHPKVIFHSRDPYKKDSWSDAIHFQFEGYDVSPFWDADGTSYVVGSHAWRVEEMIMGFQLDFSSGNIIGNISNLWPGTGGIVRDIYRCVFTC